MQIIKGVSLQYEALSHKGSPGSDAPNVDKNKTLYNRNMSSEISFDFFKISQKSAKHEN